MLLKHDYQHIFYSRSTHETNIATAIKNSISCKTNIFFGMQFFKTQTFLRFTNTFYLFFFQPLKCY